MSGFALCSNSNLHSNSIAIWNTRTHLNELLRIRSLNASKGIKLSFFGEISTQKTR